MSSSEDSFGHRRPVRSYVLRQGRMTPGQEKAYTEQYPRHGVQLSEGMLNFDQLFPHQADVTLEIGFGMGDSLYEMAHDTPETNFVGGEVHRPGVGHLLHCLDESDPTNLKVYHGDVLDLLAHVSDHSLAAVQIFFPDPWPKKKHHKRRLLSEMFVTVLKDKLQSGGVLHFATDWQPYAEEVQEMMLTQRHYLPVQAPERPVTKYERRGLRLGHVVSDLAWQVQHSSA